MRKEDQIQVGTDITFLTINKFKIPVSSLWSSRQNFCVIDFNKICEKRVEHI